MISEKYLYICVCLFPAILIPAYLAYAQQQDAPDFISPEIGDDGHVTFRIHAPEASDVTLNGSWMQGWQARETGERSGEGIWEFSTAELEPEYYTYVFFVDGVRTLDPRNPLVIRDGINHFSGFLLNGETARLYALRDVPRGTVSDVWYPSSSLDLQRRMVVYTPPGYEESNRNYPVLYLLHGGGGDERAWSELGLAPRILDNLIADGAAVPMLVVMTNGNPDQESAWHFTPGSGAEIASSGINRMANQQFEESLVQDVIPFVEATYRVNTDRGSRAVAGLSMGGFQTQNIAQEYADRFAYYGVMSIGVLRESAFGMNAEEMLARTLTKVERLNELGYELFWIACG